MQTRPPAALTLSSAPSIPAGAERRREFSAFASPYSSFPPSDVPDFPMFINLQGAKVLMVGGGRIAARRTKTLLEFGATLHVVAPNLAPEMIKLLDTQTKIRWIRESYQPRHLEGAVLAIAATNQREVNRRIGQDARSRGIWVSVADQRQECTFYFPAIVRNDAFTAGLIANDGDHVSLRKTAARLRKAMQAEPERARDVPIRKIENG